MSANQKKLNLTPPRWAVYTLLFSIILSLPVSLLLWQQQYELIHLDRQRDGLELVSAHHVLLRALLFSDQSLLRQQLLRVQILSIDLPTELMTGWHALQHKISTWAEQDSNQVKLYTLLGDLADYYLDLQDYFSLHMHDNARLNYMAQLQIEDFSTLLEVLAMVEDFAQNPDDYSSIAL